MTSRLFSSCVLGLALATLASTSDLAAQAGATMQSGATGAANRGATTRAGAKGPLPDPVLLDGSSLPAEKRPEHGMIGDFELPGDENVRNGKVGGPQGPQGQQQQGGGQQQLPGLAGMQGGGDQSQQSQTQQQQGGGPQQQQSEQSGNSPSGPQDPNAKAEGTQVAQLETDPNAGGDAGAEPGPKPQPVAIGDKAMQIKSVSNAPNVVGAQQPSTAQQMEKQVGGSKASAPAGRNATERGRAIPAGL